MNVKDIISSLGLSIRQKLIIAYKVKIMMKEFSKFKTAERKKYRDYLSPINVKQHTNGLAELNDDIIYLIGKNGSKLTITIPKGFKTDWASIPLPFQFVLPHLGNWNGPALLHDWLFQTHIVGFSMANIIMWEGMVQARVNWFRRILIYWGISSIFGYFAYKSGPDRLRKNCRELEQYIINN